MDTKHFPDFYRANFKRIYRFYFFRVGGKREIAEDLTQDVFVKALGAFESYDPETSKSAWIYTIARNHFVNYLEKSRPGVPLEDVEELASMSDDWPEQMMQRHDAKRLFTAMQELPRPDRDLIRLKFLEGWGYEDIAMQVGKTAGALRVQAHRALKVLQHILKQK